MLRQRSGGCTEDFTCDCSSPCRRIQDACIPSPLGHVPATQAGPSRGSHRSNGVWTIDVRVLSNGRNYGRMCHDDAMPPRSAGLYVRWPWRGWLASTSAENGPCCSISECNLALLALIDDLNCSIGLRSSGRRPSRHQEHERLFDRERSARKGRQARASPSASESGALHANALTGPS